MTRQKNDWSRYLELRDAFLNLFPADGVPPELESMILTDQEKKRDFVEHLHLQAAIAASLSRDQDALPASQNSMLIASNGAPLDFLSQMAPPPLWARPLLWGASVMAVVVWFGFIYLEFQSVTLQIDKPIATIHSAEGCSWGKSALPTADGSPLFAGRMHLLSGTMRIDLRNTRLTLQGPVVLELISETRCKLHNGRVLMGSNNGGDGLVIVVPNGVIADLGAEIGVYVSAAGFAELHVFSGLVKAKHCGLGESLEATESDNIQIRPDAILKLDRESGLINSRSIHSATTRCRGTFVSTLT